MGGAVLAGISGAGKTTLFRRMGNAITSAGREIVITLPQAMTTTCHLHFNNQPGRQAVEVLSWCDSAISFAELVMNKALTGGLTTSKENYPYQWNPMLLLEGACFDIPLHDFDIKRDEIRSFEHRLAALGVVLVFLRVPEERIQERCVQSTRAHRGIGWSAHLDQLGADDPARAAHFRAQQATLAQWVETSPMAKIVLDVTVLTIDAQVQTVMKTVDQHALRFVERTTPISLHH